MMIGNFVQHRSSSPFRISMVAFVKITFGNHVPDPTRRHIIQTFRDLFVVPLHYFQSPRTLITMQWFWCWGVNDMVFFTFSEVPLVAFPRILSSRLRCIFETMNRRFLLRPVFTDG